MTTKRNLGIWMDHATAHVMEFTDSIKTIVIHSKFTHEEKEKSLHKGENLMHNKEQGQQSDFYKKLAETIRDYDEVVLFGPTDAKLELLNLLKADHTFAKIEIVVKSSEKMTENQEHAFVRNYFSQLSAGKIK